MVIHVSFSTLTEARQPRWVPPVSAITVIFALMAAMPVQAASVSFFLDQSNRLSDGTNFLKVTIDDQVAIAGAIHFTLEMFIPFSNITSCKLDLDQFGFNGAELDNSNIFGLPDGWKLKNEKKMDGFGRFENVLTANAFNTHDTLTFSIIGIENDAINSYATPHDSGNGILFAAYVSGTERRGHDEGHHSQEDFCHDCSLRSVYFGGGTPTAVPVLPAALGLFGSGLLVLAGITRQGAGQRIQPGYLVTQC